MRRFWSLAAMAIVVLAVALPWGAESAHSNYNKGVDAEKRQDYERAFEYFQEAFREKPKELRYRTAYEHTKFLASAAHVHRGQLLRDGGKLDEAIVEFQKASAIDPSSFIAQQELRRTQDMINQATNPPQAVAPLPNALRKRLAEASGPVELTAISNVPITLKSTEDTKVIYEIVGKLAGINVLFDPDYTSRKIRIDLNGVTLEEALAETEARVVFATSNHVMGRYKEEAVGPGELTTELPPLPGTRSIENGVLHDEPAYAAAKLMGERLLLAVAGAPKSKVTGVALRIGWCQPGENQPRTISGDGMPVDTDAKPVTGDALRDLTWFRNMWLSNRDFCGIVEAALRADAAGWPARALVLNAMSANRGMPWDLGPTRRYLGYAPQDDAWGLLG